MKKGFADFAETTMDVVAEVFEKTGALPPSLVQHLTDAPPLTPSPLACPHCCFPVKEALLLADLLLAHPKPREVVKSWPPVVCGGCFQILHAPDRQTYRLLPPEDYSLLPLEERRELEKVHTSLVHMKEHFDQRLLTTVGTKRLTPKRWRK